MQLVAPRAITIAVAIDAIVVFLEFAATLPPTYLKRPVYRQNMVVAVVWQRGSKIGFFLLEKKLFSARENSVFSLRIHSIPTENTSYSCPRIRVLEC